MPEGPQVYYMVNELNKKFKNSNLIDLKISGGRYTRHGLPNNYKNFLTKLPTKIINFNCKGKLIWINFKNDYNLVIILAYGHFRLEKNINNNKHYYYNFITNKGTFFIEDPRNFATLDFVNSNDLEKILNKRGPSIIDGKLKKKQFIEIIKSFSPNKEICIALLDQNKISGIGNYIRADALYLAKISPYRKIKDLNENDINNLYKSLLIVINKSLKSLFKYGLGHYKKLVYKRTLTNKGEIIKHDNFKNRGIYWVPCVQY